MPNRVGIGRDQGWCLRHRVGLGLRRQCRRLRYVIRAIGGWRLRQHIALRCTGRRLCHCIGVGTGHQCRRLRHGVLTISGWRLRHRIVGERRCRGLRDRIGLGVRRHRQGVGAFRGCRLSDRIGFGRWRHGDGIGRHRGSRLLHPNKRSTGTAIVAAARTGSFAGASCQRTSIGVGAAVAWRTGRECGTAITHKRPEVGGGCHIPLPGASSNRAVAVF